MITNHLHTINNPQHAALTSPLPATTTATTPTNATLITALFTTQTLTEWLHSQQHILSSIPLYSGLFFMFEILAVPSTPLTILAGHLFTPAQAILLITTVSTLAASASFVIARYMLRARVRRFRLFKRLDQLLANSGFKLVLLTRLSPVIPFALSSYVHGVTRVRFDSFIVATFIGMLPTTLAYVSVGHATNTVFGDGDGSSGDGDGRILKGWTQVILTVIGVLATVGMVVVIGNAATKAMEDIGHGNHSDSNNINISSHNHSNSNSSSSNSGSPRLSTVNSSNIFDIEMGHQRVK